MAIKLVFVKKNIKRDIIVRYGEQMYQIDYDSNDCCFDCTSKLPIEIIVSAPRISKTRLLLIYFLNLLFAPFNILLQNSDSNWEEDIMPYNLKIKLGYMDSFNDIKDILINITLPVMRRGDLCKEKVEINGQENKDLFLVEKEISYNSINREVHRYLSKFFSTALVVYVFICMMFILSEVIIGYIPVFVLTSIYILINLFVIVSTLKRKSKIIKQLKRNLKNDLPY